MVALRAWASMELHTELRRREVVWEVVRGCSEGGSEEDGEGKGNRIFIQIKKKLKKEHVPKRWVSDDLSLISHEQRPGVFRAALGANAHLREHIEYFKKYIYIQNNKVHVLKVQR
jgi:hypothetical protein